MEVVGSGAGVLVERLVYRAGGIIAVIERFNRTLKYEGLFLIAIPFSLDRMREETRLIVEHYNRFRPHQGLTCRTPEGRKHLPVFRLRKAA